MLIFPLYNNGDKQFQIISINQLKGEQMTNIVQKPETNEFPTYGKLNKDLKTLFEFSLKQCDRFLIFESLNEVTEYLKTALINDVQKDVIKQSLKDFGFYFIKLKLNKYVEDQKVLFIYEKC